MRKPFGKESRPLTGKQNGKVTGGVILTHSRYLLLISEQADILNSWFI